MALVLNLVPMNPSTVGQARTVLLTILNTGGSDVLLSSVATYITPAAGYVAQPQFPPGATMTVAASATMTLPFSVVLLAPPMAGMALAAAQGIFQVGATVYSNDATTPVIGQSIRIAATPEIILSQSQAPTSPGWLDFGQPANTGLLGLGTY